MLRISSALALLFLAGCGGHHGPTSTSPSSAGSPLTNVDRTSRPTTDSLADQLGLPSAPMDSALVAADLAAEGRLAADSAADEAVLEELATAHPEGDEPDSSGDVAAEVGPNALADAVTWDIDVATYNSHDRVRYYLDFFQTRGRERMSIWLTRMPRYEAMIRERLQRENLPGDLVYLALIESGFSNTATSRAKAVGMWLFMLGTARG
jgi:membrane-bound lytic murein transglycosylase D